MARPRAFTNTEVDALLEIMRKRGVASFEFRGLKVNFAPTAYPSQAGSDEELDPFVAAERVKQAVEDFKKVNEDDRINLEWSV